MRIKIAFLFSVFLAIPSYSDFEFKPGLLSVTAGSWVVFPDAAPDKPLYFNKAALDFYYSLGPISGEIALPAAWTIVSSPSNRRFFLGDALLYFGHRFSHVEPRIGLVIPLGYGLDTNWKSKTWIGTNNLKLQFGLAYSRSAEELNGFPLSIEVTVSTPITEKNSFLKIGSYGGSLLGKTSWQLNNQLTLGAQALVSLSYAAWTWYQDETSETSLGLMPLINSQIDFRSNLFLSVSAGFGPTFKATSPSSSLSFTSNSLNVSVGLNYYP